ncbi:hypothetical protein D6792_01090 [Candidatus Parcubacteria bacterium]|jgi:ribosomal protein S21|nr:MAG: hypothetical protein D6792_01090 [Candidatus Parcubacteria bacterium]GIW69189.1 MAG: hypothetical protein KatS3mg100_683 [Candidatus Parcubacteria bacterium]
MPVNVVVTKNERESAHLLLRRFQRKVQSMGVVQEVRNRRFREREQSRNSRRTQRVLALKRRALYEKLEKLGLRTRHNKGTVQR